MGKEQEFKETGPMTNMSMLLLACAAFAMPTVGKKFRIRNNFPTAIYLGIRGRVQARNGEGGVAKHRFGDFQSRLHFLVAQLHLFSDLPDVSLKCHVLGSNRGDVRYTHLSIFESEGGENEDEPTINVPTSLTLLLVRRRSQGKSVLQNIFAFFG